MAAQVEGEVQRLARWRDHRQDDAVGAQARRSSRRPPRPVLALRVDGAVRARDRAPARRAGRRCRGR